jgi:hypothetical protein
MFSARIEFVSQIWMGRVYYEALPFSYFQKKSFDSRLVNDYFQSMKIRPAGKRVAAVLVAVIFLSVILLDRVSCSDCMPVFPSSTVNMPGQPLSLASGDGASPPPAGMTSIPDCPICTASAINLFMHSTAALHVEHLFHAPSFAAPPAPLFPIIKPPIA